LRAPAEGWISFVAHGKNQTMRDPIDISVRAKSRLAVIETIVCNNRANFEIDPARERHAMF
jgi:hypothetical protein